VLHSPTRFLVFETLNLCAFVILFSRIGRIASKSRVFDGQTVDVCWPSASGAVCLSMVRCFVMVSAVDLCAPGRYLEEHQIFRVSDMQYKLFRNSSYQRKDHADEFLESQP